MVLQELVSIASSSCVYPHELVKQHINLLSQNYSQDCIKTRDCQAQILEIDSNSDISIYSLSTVASVFQLSVNQIGTINQKDNINGFASTVTAWTRGSYRLGPITT